MVPKKEYISSHLRMTVEVWYIVNIYISALLAFLRSWTVTADRDLVIGA